MLLVQWPPRDRARVRRDGTVRVTSAGLGNALADTRMCSMPTTDATELLAVLRDAPSSVYSATPGALNSFTKTLADELGPHVWVNATALGSIRTPTFERAYLAQMTSDQPSDYEHYVHDAYPAQRISEPQDVAEAAVYLTSEDARRRWLDDQIGPTATPSGLDRSQQSVANEAKMKPSVRNDAAVRPCTPVARSHRALPFDLLCPATFESSQIDDTLKIV